MGELQAVEMVQVVAPLLQHGDGVSHLLDLFKIYDSEKPRVPAVSATAQALCTQRNEACKERFEDGSVPMVAWTMDSFSSVVAMTSPL
jgi:hypothetical protein